MEKDAGKQMYNEVEEDSDMEVEQTFTWQVGKQCGYNDGGN